MVLTTEKKKNLARDRDRDVSEQIALGNANVQQTSNDRQSYDQRLFDKVSVNKACSSSYLLRSVTSDFSFDDPTLATWCNQWFSQ